MNAQELLSLVDHQKIWQNIVGESRLNHSFLRPSWLGSDKRPSCRLSLKGDKIRFYDPPLQINWDILDGYKALYPQDTWHEIEDTILKWNGSTKPTSELLNSGELAEKKFILIPKIVEWSDFGINYWAKRGVSIKRLSNPSTLTQEVCGHELVGTNAQGDFYSSQFGQGFVFHCNGKVKIYYPDIEKYRKWKGRFQPEDVWIVDRTEHRAAKGVPDNKTLLICKGNKDLLVWSTIVSCDLMNVSGEGVFPNLNWLMENVRMKYERVVICFDGDDAGVLGSNKLLNILESISDIGTFVCKIWNWPSGPSKDLDEYRVEHGKPCTIKFLKENHFHKIFS